MGNSSNQLECVQQEYHEILAIPISPDTSKSDVMLMAMDVAEDGFKHLIYTDNEWIYLVGRSHISLTEEEAGAVSEAIKDLQDLSSPEFIFVILNNRLFKIKVY